MGTTGRGPAGGFVTAPARSRTVAAFEVRALLALSVAFMASVGTVRRVESGASLFGFAAGRKRGTEAGFPECGAARNWLALRAEARP